MTTPRKKTAPRTSTRQKPPAPPQPKTSDQPIIGILCGREVAVLPMNQWRNSAMRALRSGDLDTWADIVLDDDGYDVWEEEDPTFEEVTQFFASFSDEMAVNAPQIPGANRAQRRARRG